MLTCPAFEIFYGGCAGGGKSAGLLLDAISQIDEPGYKALLLRRTYSELSKADGLIEESQKIYMKLGGVYTAGEKRWRFPSNAIIDFGHCENESDKHKYQSSQYDKILFDELTSFTETQYLYLFSRCRGTNPKINRGIRSASNPGNVGHVFCKRRFIDGKQPYKIYTDEYKNTSCFIPASIYDNPHIINNDPQYINRLKMLPENDRKALLEGNWDIFEGQYFAMWDRNKIVQEKPILESFRKFISIDYGYAAPASVGWWGISYDGELIRYRELYQENLTYEDLAHNICNLTSADEILDYAVADPAIWGDKSHQKNCIGESGAETMTKVFKERWKDNAPSLIKGDNNRITGWMRLREYINANKIFCWPNCVDSIRTIPTMLHDKIKVEDLDSMGEDHTSDDWRYAVMSRVRPSEIPIKKPVSVINKLKTLEESDEKLQELFMEN